MRLRSPLPSSRRRQSGASLLEVLIAVLILAIGLLGIAALQSVSLRNMQSSSDRTVAMIQTYAIFDMMRANRAAAQAGAYNTGGYMCEAPDGATRSALDTARWITQAQAAMGPSACGAITCNAAGRCDVQMRWNEARATGGEEQHEITTRTEL